MNRIAHAFIGTILMTAVSGNAVAEPSITELPLEGGGMQRVLYAGPSNPRAALIMLPGGNGMVEFGPGGTFRRMGNSFLLRTLPLWPEQGFAVAVLSSPNGMSLLGYRHTPAYAAAIGQAIDFIRSRAAVPVFLVGSSQGATAAVGGAARLGEKVAGIILMSSVTGRSSAGETLFDSDPGQVTVPALIVSNTGDTCAASAPKDVPKIVEALARAPRKDIVYLESTAFNGSSCGAESPHGYHGIEQETVGRVTKWIASLPVP